MARRSPHSLQPRLRPTRRDARGASARSWSGGTTTAGVDRTDVAGLRARPSRRRISRRTTRAATRRLPATQPFIMHPDGVGWIWVPSGLKDGPLPTHYEPFESPVSNRLYRAADESRGRSRRSVPTTATRPSLGDARYPHVLTTYRLTEHHTAGGMTRTLSHLAELQPELFCGDLAGARGANRRSERRVGRRRRRRAADRGTRAGHRRAFVRSSCKAHAPPGRPALPLRPSWSRQRRRRERPGGHFRGAERPDHGVEGARVRRQGGGPGTSVTHAENDGISHRLDALHRLQGLRGRVQGMERRSRRRVQRSRDSPTTTPPVWATRRGGTSSSSSAPRDPAPAGDAGTAATSSAGTSRRTCASTARTRDASRPAPPDRSSALSSAAFSSSPTSATVAATVSSPAPSASSTAGPTTGARSSAPSATTGRKQGCSRRARPPARPQSILFGEIEDLRARATSRLRRAGTSRD